MPDRPAASAAERMFLDAAKALDRLVCDVGASGVEHDDPRLGYVTVQIDRDVWNRVREVVAHPLRTVPDA